MKLLSVDWDYFFPDVVQFDWGHREAPIFMEALWSLRASSRSLETGKFAVDVVRPNRKLLNGFWEKVLAGSPLQLFIAESHHDLFRVMSAYQGPWEVTNFDQHHDMSYGEQSRTDDCGSWAYHGIVRGMISRYRLVYPRWRKASPESDWPEVKVPVEVRYCRPKPVVYDAVFVCRSSAWTPSWGDHAWLKFVSWWKEKRWSLWSSRSTVDFVRRARKPDLKEAVRLKAEMNRQLEEMQKRGLQNVG